jgi:hypothetical protein
MASGRARTAVGHQGREYPVASTPGARSRPRQARRRDGVPASAPAIGRESTPQLTLILVIMRPGEGVWQTVDARVTAGGQLRDNFAYKQLSVHRWDGTLLLAYTGLAEVHPSGESMFDWIRTTLRGRNQGIEADLLHLQERLTRDIGRSRYRRVPLTIVAAGVVGSRPDENAPLAGRRMARWVLTNETWPNGASGASRVEPAFKLEGQWIDHSSAMCFGSGMYAVKRSTADSALLHRALAYRPRRPRDYVGLLAAVNRRAAPRSGGTVSPWCSGVYMPELGQGLEYHEFSEHGDPQPGTPAGIPCILFGIDQTDLIRQMMTAIRNRSLRLSAPPDIDFDDSVRLRP